MTLPPLLGAVQDTVAAAFPPVAVTPVGVPGACAGVTALDAADAGPDPKALLAVTLNVYVVPFVSPVTVTLVAGGDPDTMVAFCATVPSRSPGPRRCRRWR